MNRWTSVLLAFGGLIAFPLVDSAIKGTLILVLAVAVCLWLRKDSAATRHFVWTIAIGLLVAMPVLSLVLPQWRILPGWMNSEPVTLQQISLPELPSEATLVEADAFDELAQPNKVENLPADMSDLKSDVLNAPDPLTESGPSDAVSVIGPVDETATTLPAWISVTWLIGCAILFFRLSIAAVMLRRSERRCVVIQRSHHAPRDERGSESRESNIHPLASGMRQLSGPESLQSISVAKSTEYRPVDIPRSPEELGIALEQSKLALRLKRPVVVLLDPKRSIPIVWGLWKTRLQLPKEVLQWSDEQLQSVLLHELAHIRRRDLFVLALTQIACALHWFNPLVWIAAWRLHVERERACDDLVLNTGIRASSYAEHLLNVATRLTSSQWTQACGLAMARNSLLHGRLSAVLSEKQNRRSVTTALAIGLIVTATAVAAPMAMLRGSDDTQNEDAKTDVTNGDDDTSTSDQKTGAGVFNEIGEKPIPFTEAFNDLAWGEFHETGLRAAVVMDLQGDSVPLGTVAKRKLILHNKGEKPVTIRLASVHHHQLSPVVAGRPVIIDYKPTRLRSWTEVPPNSCIGLDASGIGFGDDLTETQRLQIPFIQRVSVVAGDSFSTSAELRLLIGTQPDNVLSLEEVRFKSGEVKLRILPWLPDAPRKVRTADTVGNYIVADNLRLFVDRDAREADQYTARLVRSKSQFPDSESIWESDKITVTWPFQFVWIRNSGTVWLAESSGIRKLIYAEKAEVQDVDQQELQSIPKRLREYLDPSLERFRLPSRAQNQSGPVPVNMPEGLEQLLDWSEPVNGLRAAVAIRSSLTGNAPGKDLRILVVMQNVSEDTIRFCPSTKHESKNRNSVFLQSMGLSVGGHSFAPSDFPPKIEATIPPQKVFWFDFLAHQAEHLPDEEHRELCEQLVQHIVDHPHQTLSVSLQVPDAQEGAWTGTLSTPPTRGGLGSRPSDFPDASCNQLYAHYLANAQRHQNLPGDIPGGLLTELRDMVQQFMHDNKDNPSAALQVKQFELLAERFNNTGDWKQDEVIALLHDIASISTVPLKRASEKTAAPPAIGTVAMNASASFVEIEPTQSGNELAVPAENSVLKGDSVVAKVNGKPITVDDVLCGGRQLIEAHTSLSETVRARVIRESVQKRLRKRVDDELVMQELERKIPKEKRDSIRETIEPQFDEFLAAIKKDNGFKTDDELAAKLATEGNTISSVRELFMRSQMIDGYLSSLIIVPKKFTVEELRKYYEEHPDNYAVWRKSDSDGSEVAQIIQPFDEVQKNVEQHLRRKLREEGRANALEEIRSRSTVEVFVELERDQDAEPEANANRVKHPDARAVLQDGNPERTSEKQAIVASLLATETERALISLENSRLDLEAKRSVNKEHTEAYSADELKLAELEVAEKEAVLWHAVALLKEATLQKDASGLTGDAKSLAEAKAAVRLAETNIARRRLGTLELTQQLNQAANQKTPGTYTSEEMEKLAVEIESAKARIAELTGGPTEKPQAAKAHVEQQGNLRIATHPGLFEVGNRVFLWVARKLHPDPDENGASLVRVSKEGKQINIDIPLPPGEGTWAAGWVRGGKVLWVAQKGKITRYDFSDAEQVQITDETQSSTDAAGPKELNALMQQAIGEDSSKTDASQDASQGHGSEPASPDEPRASLDPIENPSRRTITWEDLAINATTLADIRDEQMALDEVSEDLKTLDGKRVVLRGYMYPTFEATGLTKFVICRHNAAMILSHSPLLDQIVNVHLLADTDTDYIEGRPFDVEGIFRVKPAYDANQKLSGLYHVEDAQIQLKPPATKSDSVEYSRPSISNESVDKAVKSEPPPNDRAITGKLLLPDGAPAAGYSVKLVSAGYYTKKERGSSFKGKGLRGSAVVVGDDGRFSVPVPEVGNFTVLSLNIIRDGFIVRAIEATKLGDFGTIQLLKPRIIVGRVMLADRTVVPNATVKIAMSSIQLKHIANDQSNNLRMTTCSCGAISTDDQGNFATPPLEPGIYLMTAGKTASLDAPLLPLISTQCVVIPGAERILGDDYLQVMQKRAHGNPEAAERSLVLADQSDEQIRVELKALASRDLLISVRNDLPEQTSSSLSLRRSITLPSRFEIEPPGQFMSGILDSDLNFQQLTDAKIRIPIANDAVLAQISFSTLSKKGKRPILHMVRSIASEPYRIDGAVEVQKSRSDLVELVLKERLQVLIDVPTLQQTATPDWGKFTFRASGTCGNDVRFETPNWGRLDDSPGQRKLFVEVPECENLTVTIDSGNGSKLHGQLSSVRKDRENRLTVR